MLALHMHEIQGSPKPLEITHVEHALNALEIFELLHRKLAVKEKAESYHQPTETRHYARGVNAAFAKKQVDQEPKNDTNGLGRGVDVQTTPREPISHVQLPKPTPGGVSEPPYPFLTREDREILAAKALARKLSLIDAQKGKGKGESGNNGKGKGNGGKGKGGEA